jgi:hypothetical protein
VEVAFTSDGVDATNSDANGIRMEMADVRLIGVVQPCACANASRCKPLARTVEREVFTFSPPDTPNGWRSFDLSTITTIEVWDDVDPMLVCHAHERSVRLVACAGSGPIAWLESATARAAAAAYHVKAIASDGLAR